MKPKSFAKLLVFINALVPLAILLFDYSQDRLGADPYNYFVRTSGLLAVIFLILSLSITPLRRLTGRNYWSSFRRMLGLFAFFYAACHLSIFIYFKRGETLKEILNSNFIFYGMTAFFLIAPLALTSTAASIKRMGAKNWKLLHKLAYLAAFLAALHYNLSFKVPNNQAIIIGLIIDALLLFRLGAYLWDLVARRRKARAAVQGFPVEVSSRR